MLRGHRSTTEVHAPDDDQKCADAHSDKKEPDRLWDPNVARGSFLESHGAGACCFIAGWAVDIDPPYKIPCNDGENDHADELGDDANHHYCATMGQLYIVHGVEKVKAYCFHLGPILPSCWLSQPSPLQRIAQRGQRGPM
jgi:hypothetical protein